jgi:hypothetical protein
LMSPVASKTEQSPIFELHGSWWMLRIEPCRGIDFGPATAFEVTTTATDATAARDSRAADHATRRLVRPDM